MSKAAMEIDLESRQVTIQQLVAASQSFQQNNDNLMEERNCRSRAPEECEISALNHQIAATLAAVEERKLVQQELDCAMNANHALATSLATAQNHGKFCEGRMIELCNAMDKTPNEVANMSGVIAQKDKLFSDLENRAGECLTALIKLKEKRGEEKTSAGREIATLKAKLGRKEKIIADLRKSKSSHQSQRESIFAILQSKVHRDDVISALEESYQTANQDNSTLTTEVERLDSELSSQELKITSLEAAIREAERSLKEEKESSKEVILALTSKDTELGALQMKLDSLEAEHQSIIDEKDDRLADADWRLREAYNATVELMVKGREERERHFIKRKDDKIAALERKCQELSSDHQQLERYIQTQAEVSARNAWAASVSKVASEETLVNLREAQAHIEHQHELLQGRLGLPASLSVTQALAIMKALSEAQEKIEELENQLRDHSGQDPDSYGVNDDDLYGVSDEE